MCFTVELCLENKGIIDIWCYFVCYSGRVECEAMDWLRQACGQGENLESGGPLAFPMAIGTECLKVWSGALYDRYGPAGMGWWRLDPLWAASSESGEDMGESGPISGRSVGGDWHWHEQDAGTSRWWMTTEIMRSYSLQEFPSIFSIVAGMSSSTGISIPRFCAFPTGGYTVPTMTREFCM